ncbi:MAG: beta-lactamase family protein [Xanthomonadales bacterium]|nr:beta-lactamase family protein [Xanthomonadales bacterium]
MKQLALILMLLASSLSALSQQPPAHEIRLIDATVELMRDQQANAIDRYLDKVLSPAARQPREEMVDALNAARHAIGTGEFGLTVEKTPLGVALIFARDERETQLDMALDTTGLLKLSLADSQGGMEAAVRRHVRALEGSHLMPDALDVFEREHFSEQYLSETTREERRSLIDRLREIAASAGGAMIVQAGNEYQLTLQTREKEFLVAFSLEPEAPFAISALSITGTQAETMSLSWETLPQTFDQLAEEGFTGVVRVLREGQVVLDKAYGMANPAQGFPMKTDTIFGIGSTPIDFTVAGIFHLVETGRLALDDSIAMHLPGVPQDKAAMTLRHILNGQSGLPDFHDVPTDWEADLAWIDRSEALRRILSQPLMFVPGQGRAHSHSAYGLAAAVIEMVSGMDYFEFMSEQFFRPAGMNRTGMYGEHGGYALSEFAVGNSELGVGLPNIPPNWGPTSWLVMGSGGMWSTVDDLRKFYDYVGNGGGLSGQFADHFSGARLVVGGSQRGFHIVEVQRDPGTWAMFIINQDGRGPRVRMLTRALEELVEGTGS